MRPPLRPVQAGAGEHPPAGADPGQVDPQPDDHEHIFHAWDEALGAKDLDAALALYQPDATLESALVCHLLGTDQGMVRGQAELRPFVERVFAHQPPERRRFRAGYLTDGPGSPGSTPGGARTVTNSTWSK